MGDDRRDEWRTWVDKTLREHDVLYERQENRIHNAQTIANEARAEFRAIRDEIKKELREMRTAIEGDYAGDHPGMKQDIADLKTMTSQKEKREGYRWAFRTAFWPVVVVQFLILIGLVVVNWDKIREYVVLHQHIRQAAAIEKNTKRLRTKRVRRPRPAPPPPVREDEPPDEEQPNAEK